MRLAKVALVILCGFLGALAIGAGAKAAMVHLLGEGLHRLPDIQLERLRLLQAGKPPITGAPVAILGDSSAAFSIDALSFPDADSFATVNSTSVEAYFTLKKLLEHGASLRCVVGSFTLEWTQNRKFFWTMFVANHFYDEGELAEILNVSRSFGEAPGADPGPWRAVRRIAAESGVWDDVYVSRIQAGLASVGWQRKQVQLYRDSVWRHRGSSPLPDASRYEGALDLTFGATPAVTRTEAEFFRRFLRILAEKRIALYLFEVPFSEEVPETERAAYWARYEELLNGLRDQGMPEIHFVRSPALPSRFLISAGHLNAFGIQRTAALLRDATNPCYH